MLALLLKYLVQVLHGIFSLTPTLCYLYYFWLELILIKEFSISLTENLFIFPIVQNLYQTVKLRNTHWSKIWVQNKMLIIITSGKVLRAS